MIVPLELDDVVAAPNGLEGVKAPEHARTDDDRLRSHPIGQRSR
jgi:hypothetical protein